MFNKRFALAVISVLMVILVSMTSTSVFAADESEFGEKNDVISMSGDVNGDGVVNIDDVTEYQFILAGSKEATDAFEMNGETYADGKKNINDVTVIQYYIAGILKKLPVDKDGYDPTIYQP